MPVKKRGYNSNRRKAAKRYGKPVPVMNTAAKTIQAAVRRAISKNIETKSACKTSSDYQQIQHNNFIALEAGDLLATTQGVQDPNNSALACRIGDQINLKNISIRMMIELNERYSHVTYRILVIKAAKDDSLAANNLFCNLSGNKMIDRIDREKFTVLYEKWGTIKNDTQGGGRAVAEDTSATNLATGLYIASGAGFQFSRVTKMIKINLPGTLFKKNGIIQYENGSSQVKMHDYHLLIYAYSNYNTSQAIGYNVLAVNDYVKEMYYKDA